MPGRTLLGRLYCRKLGSGHGTGAGRARSTVGVAWRLLSLESKVGFDSACFPLEEDGVKAVARPVSVLKPSIVSRLPEDSGSRASLTSLEEIIYFFFLSFFMYCSGADGVASKVAELS